MSASAVLMATLPLAKFISGPPAAAPSRGRRLLILAPIALMIVGGAILAYPFIPKLQYAIARPTPVIPYASDLLQKAAAVKSVPAPAVAGQPAAPNVQPRVSKIVVSGTKPKPVTNRLVIPTIGVDMPILEGPTEKVLDRGGAWHLPNTSDPSKGGNTVLSGHRWKYLPPSSMTLYLLDRVQDGDPIIIYWKGVEYDYIVSGRKVVTPKQVDILNNTDSPRLTIFTCTPLFSTSHRLVLFADLIS